MSKSIRQSEISTKTLAICALGAATIALAYLQQNALAGASLIALAVAVLLPKDCSKRVLRAMDAFKNDGCNVEPQRVVVERPIVVATERADIERASAHVNSRQFGLPDKLHDAPGLREAHLNFRTQSCLRHG